VPLLFALGEPLGGSPPERAQGLGRCGEGCPHGGLSSDARQAGKRILHDGGRLLDPPLGAAGDVKHDLHATRLVRAVRLSAGSLGRLVFYLVAKPSASDVVPTVVSAEARALHDMALDAIADA
jgi:hypothetical protein